MTIDEKVKEPSLTQKAIKETGETFPYRDNIAKYIRGLETADPKELEKQGIIKGGKIEGLKLYEAINNVAKALIRQHLGDSEDYNWRPQWEQFKALVERFGQQGKISYDLVEQVLALYVNAAQTHAGERNIGRTRGAPLAEAKTHTNEIAKIVGQGDIYGSQIDRAHDPTAVVQIKSQLEPRLREKIAERYAIKGDYKIAA